MVANTQRDVIQGTNIDQVLSQGDMNIWVIRHKWALLSGILVVVAAVIGHGFYRNHAATNKMKDAQAISTFISGPLKQFEEKKIEAAEVVQETKKLAASTKQLQIVAPAVMKASDMLAEKEPAGALEVLSLIEGPWMSSNRPMALLVSLRKAALQEDLGRNAEAISTLETQLQKQYKVLETKIYFDLGRLSLKTGDKERAKKNFAHILETAPQGDDFTKMAKIYLQDLK
jgi:predicted negative regulator of RcsB-dependent stress response